MTKTLFRLSAAAATLSAGVTMAIAHGDVAPQPVDTGTLPELGEEWLIENPYRAEAGFAGHLPGYAPAGGRGARCGA